MRMDLQRVFLHPPIPHGSVFALASLHYLSRISPMGFRRYDDLGNPSSL